MQGRGWASLMAWCPAGPNGPGEGGSVISFSFLLCFFYSFLFLFIVSSILVL